MASNDNQRETDKALGRSLQSRIELIGYDAKRVVDQLLMRIERHTLEVGELDLSKPGEILDLTITFLARQIAERDAERAERLRAIEDEEIAVYGRIKP